MKKQLSLLLAIAPLLLACGNTDSNSMLPSGGKAVEVAAAAEVLKTAIVTEADSDKIGIQISNLNLGLDVTVDETHFDSAGSGTAVHQGGSLSLTNGSIFAGVGGLTGSDASTFQGVANFQADIAEKLTTPTASVDTSFQAVKANLYVKDRNTYIDLSDPNFVALINSLPFDSDGGANMTATKLLIPDNVNDQSFPLISPDSLTQIQGIGAQVGEWVKQNATRFTAISYDDGSYGISGSLTKEDFAPAFTPVTSETISSSASVPEPYTNLSLAKFNIGLTFSASGLKNLKFDFEASTTFTSEDSYTQGDASSQTVNIIQRSEFALTAKLGFDLSFLSGNEVVLTFPSDLNTYVPQNTK